MRILLVNKYWRRQGGVEEYCFLLRDVLEEFGHEVVPFSQIEADTEPTPWSKYFVSPVDPTASGTRERVRSARRAVIGDETTAAIRRLLDDVQIDAAHVVHAYHQLSPMFMRELARRSIPTLLSIHDYKLCCPSYRLLNDTTQQICTICLDNPRRRATAPAATRCWRGSRVGGALLGAEAAATKLAKPYLTAARVLVSNELMHRCAESAGVEPERIVTVPNFWPAPKATLKRSPGEAVLFIGRLVVEKGVDVLIRAAASSHVPLRVIGDGPLMDELQRLAQGLSAPVEFLGALWGSDSEREMLRARALVVPSVWHEVSPLVIYQAMTLGVPVIASDVGGIPDLLQDERGTLIPPADVSALASELGALAAGPGPYERRAERAREYSMSELSRERFATRLARAYRDAGVSL